MRVRYSQYHWKQWNNTSKISNFLSHWCEVITYRDKKFERIEFLEGEFKERKVGTTTEHSGTCVSWQPSEEFFTHTEVELGKIKELLKTTVCLCPGLEILCTINEENIRYYSERGLDDLVDDKVSDKEIIKNRFHCIASEGKNQIDFILTYITSYTSTVVPYVNTGLTEKGPHISTIKALITREFNKFFRDQKWLKEKDENLSGEDIAEGSYIVFNITAPNVAYDAQVKSTVTRLDMRPFASALSENLQIWLEKNKSEIKEIADKAINARKAREAAKKARDNVRNKPREKGLKAKMAISDKFIDCSSKNPKERNLLLVEGMSAGSSAIEARNVKTDCIYMLRGKTISPLKTSKDKIVANQEMSDIINIIGAGFDTNFDVSKMQFDKIVITSDAK